MEGLGVDERQSRWRCVTVETRPSAGGGPRLPMNRVLTTLKGKPVVFRRSVWVDLKTEEVGEFLKSLYSVVSWTVYRKVLRRLPRFPTVIYHVPPFQVPPFEAGHPFSTHFESVNIREKEEPTYLIEKLVGPLEHGSPMSTTNGAERYRKTEYKEEREWTTRSKNGRMGGLIYNYQSRTGIRNKRSLTSDFVNRAYQGKMSTPSPITLSLFNSVYLSFPSGSGRI